jgi:hypothetical protein
MLTHQASHGVATEIHKHHGLGQQQSLASYFADAYSRPALPVVKADRMKSGEVVQAPEANIVAIMGISLAGIPQTNYEFHHLEFMGIQSPDIMADSVDAKQMLLTLNNKLDWPSGLIFASI